MCCGWEVFVKEPEHTRGARMSSEKDQALVKEKAFVKYERLLEQAETEGRISGRFRCIVCGMKYHEKDNAEDCCRVVLEAGNV
jgi:hypothetical protein